MKCCVPVSHLFPVHPAAHVHSPGSMQVPPFIQSGEHTAVIICTLNSTYSLMKWYIPVSHLSPVHPAAHEHSPGSMQVPPFMQSGEHTAVIRYTY